MSSESPTNERAIRFEPDPEQGLLFATAREALPALDADKLRSLLEEAGYGDCSISESRFREFLDQAREGATDRLPLAELRDGEARVRISEDRLTAWLMVTPPAGGRALAFSDAEDIIRDAGVEYGYDSDAARAAVHQPDGDEQVIARGRPPEHGMDAWFESLIPEFTERRPQIDERERADFRELGGVLTVEENQALIRRHPPTEGTPGTDVQGRAIRPEPGKPKPFKGRMKGVEIDAEDPDLLRASTSGQPIWENETVMVSPTLDLENIDLSVGNIDFNGTVRVRGDIAYGMRVRARDDLHVGGSVEGAFLEAGRSVLVRGGVIGQRRRGDAEFNARIQSGGWVQARFLEHVQVRADAEVLIRDMAAHCDIAAGERIAVGAKGTRHGHLLGGRYESWLVIRALQLGGPAAVDTQLRVGNLFELKKHIRALGRRMRDSNLSPEDQEEMAERQQKLMEVERTVKEEAAIIAEEAVYTKVTMHIGTTSRYFHEDCPGGVYRRLRNTIDVEE